MKTEARELYCYTVGTEPFATEINNASKKMIGVALHIEIKRIVENAKCQYIKDYCTNGYNPFTDKDSENVAMEILYDLEEDEDEEEVCDNEYAKEFCEKRGYDFFDADMELEWRKPINSLEERGVFFVICEWIWENLDHEDDLEGIYNNVHGWRENVKGGSFNVDDNFKLYDIEERLEISDFILNGTCVYAEVTDAEYDKVVGYIRLN